MPRPNIKNLVAVSVIVVMAMLLISACASHDVADVAEEPTYTWVSTVLFGTSGDLDPYKSADYYLADFVPDKLELRTESNTYVLDEYEPENPEEGYSYLKFTEFNGNKADECILKYKPTASAGAYLRYNARLDCLQPCVVSEVGSR